MGAADRIPARHHRAMRTPADECIDVFQTAAEFKDQGVVGLTLRAMNTIILRRPG